MESRPRRMQCKDIPDIPVLQFLDLLNGRWACSFGNDDGSPAFENSIQHGMPPNVPWKLAIAKMAKLIGRGLADGCTCGCRGDFVITEKGRQYLAAHITPGGTNDRQA